MALWPSLILTTFFVAAIYGLSNKDCPLSSKVTSCSPKCKDDTECLGLKCCPNICNSRSCLPANQHSQGDGYKQSKTSATGSYCGNTKCNSFEKCEQDRSTKRYRCVRT